jgi:hypothetical protein
MSKDICEQCENQYERVTTHWARSSSCSHPDLSYHQKQIITGTLMGDGIIEKDFNRNPSLVVRTITPNYLKHIDEKFGLLGTGVSACRTAEEGAKSARSSGIDKDANAENYSKLYRWASVNHPDLHEFHDWYSTGQKVWPEKISLTPTVLKHWYCCDGHYDNREYNNRIKIAMSNEIENKKKIKSMFRRSDLPEPSNYTKYGHIEFTVDSSKYLWEYMGEPLPDFDYKWPDRYQ